MSRLINNLRGVFGGRGSNNNNNNNNSNNNDPDESVRIQLYWELGYMWQELDYEFEEFCMVHNYDGHPGYGKCFYGTKAGDCKPDRVYIAPCSNSNKQKWDFQDLPHEPRGGEDTNEFLIKAVADNNNKCMELMDTNNKNIRLRTCDAANERQRWYSGPGGSNTDDLFILSQKRQAVNNTCLGNHHHPKSGEVLEMRNCARQQHLGVLYWERA